MPQITVTSPLLYLGILFLIAGVFLVLAGQDVIKVEKVTVTKSKKTSVFGLMLVGLGVVFLLPELSKSVPQSIAPTLTNAPTESVAMITPTSTPVQPTVTVTSMTIIKSPIANLAPQPMLVRWGPTAGYVAGICVSNCDNFVAWQELKIEIETRLLPQVARVYTGSTVRLSQIAGKNDWVVEVIDQSGVVYANVWFGPDPEKAWSFDGLVRVGVPTPIDVWNTFQRYSDGTYNLLK